MSVVLSCRLRVEATTSVVNMNNHLCPDCGKTFKSISGLRRHRLRHGGRESIVCDICSRTFVEKGHYDGHMKTHSIGEKEKCGKCGKTFSYKSTLVRHAATCNPVTPVRKYVCGECGLYFDRSETLNDHLKGVHQHDRRFACDTCGATYAWRSSLSKHKKATHWALDPRVSFTACVSHANRLSYC